MKNTLLIGLLIPLIIAGCSHRKNPETKKINNLATQTVKEELQQNDSTSIELNNGEKWKVAPEMMKYIRAMENDVTELNAAKPAELKGYLELAKKLQANINLLTSNCTMEGKAHDELHKWLLPFIEMADELTAAQNIEEAQSIFEKIILSFETLNHYFV